MKERISTLLVHQESDTLRSLKAALERQGVRVIQAESCAQAKRMLGGVNPAPLVFTDTQMPDGTWVDILAVAEKAPQHVNVIVVARVVDTRFYVEAIEAGAFDFIAPPFTATDLAHVIRCAADNVIARRAAAKHSDYQPEEGLFSSAPESSAHATTH